MLLLWSHEHLSYDAMYLHWRCNTLILCLEWQLLALVTLLLFMILCQQVFYIKYFCCGFFFFFLPPLLFVKLVGLFDFEVNWTAFKCYDVQRFCGYYDTLLYSICNCSSFNRKSMHCFMFSLFLWVCRMMCSVLFCCRVVHTLHWWVDIVRVIVKSFDGADWREALAFLSLPASISLVLQLGCDTSSPLPIGGATSTRRAQCTITIHELWWWWWWWWLYNDLY